MSSYGSYDYSRSAPRRDFAPPPAHPPAGFPPMNPYAAPMPAPYAGGPPGYGSAPPYPGFPPVPPVPFNSMNPMEQSPLDAEIQVVIREIHAEQALFEAAGDYGDQFKNARRLLAAEADKLENNIDPEWLEVDIQKAIKVTKKILIPNFRHPHFNFVGKILGPKGAALQLMAKTHKCHIYVLGRGSTKDRKKEQELLNTGDPQYAHYGGPLHVKVETIAPAHVAYLRIANVLEVMSNVLQPIRENTDPNANENKTESGGNGNTDGDAEGHDETEDDLLPSKDDSNGRHRSSGGGRGRGGRDGGSYSRGGGYSSRSGGGGGSNSRGRNSSSSSGYQYMIHDNIQ